MGKGLLLIVASLVVITTGVLSQITSTTIEGEQQAYEQASKLIAREIVQSGLATAKQTVFDAFDEDGEYTGDSTIAGTYNDGSYSVTVSQNDSMVVFTGAGTFYGVRYSIVEAYELAKGVPPFMSHAITCGKTVNLNKGIELTSADSTVNASLFANEHLHLGTPSKVEGFGFYGDGSSISNAASIFMPNDNPGNADLLQQSGTLDIPLFDPTEFEAIATQKTYGNLSLGGAYVLGTRENPVIWYVDGNLTTSLPVIFTGYGALVVNGKVTISDNLISDTSGNESTFALYGGKGITTSSQATILSGQWFSNSNTTIAGDATFTGSMTMADSNCNFAKKLEMVYMTASEALTEDFWSSGDISQVEAREW